MLTNGERWCIIQTYLIKSGGGNRSCEARQPDYFGQGANSCGLSGRWGFLSKIKAFRI